MLLFPSLIVRTLSTEFSGLPAGVADAPLFIGVISLRDDVVGVCAKQSNCSPRCCGRRSLELTGASATRAKLSSPASRPGIAPHSALSHAQKNLRVIADAQAFDG